MRTLLYAITALAGAAMVPAAAGAVTIANASFEESGTAGDPGAGFVVASQLPGWTIENTIDHIGGYWQAQDGTRSIDLAGNSAPAAISQTLGGLTAGTAYIVSFFISANPDSGTPNPRTGSLQLGSTNNTVSYTLNGNTRADMQWQQVSYSFVADASTALLRLSSSADSGAFGLAVDNFAISAAPEPAAWAMMIFGFGIAGSAIRRGRQLPKLRLA